MMYQPLQEMQCIIRTATAALRLTRDELLDVLICSPYYTLDVDGRGVHIVQGRDGTADRMSHGRVLAMVKLITLLKHRDLWWSTTGVEGAWSRLNDPKYLQITGLTVPPLTGDRLHDLDDEAIRTLIYEAEDREDAEDKLARRERLRRAALPSDRSE